MADWAERHDFRSRFLLFILLFFFLFLGGKRKGEKNSQSRGQKSCLSARSKWPSFFVRCAIYKETIPFIIFERDFKIFKEKFPDLLIMKKINFKPLHYLFSGGFSYKPIFNGFFFYLLIKIVEITLFPFNRFLGMFMFIKLVKK